MNRRITKKKDKATINKILAMVETLPEALKEENAEFGNHNRFYKWMTNVRQNSYLETQPIGVKIAYVILAMGQWYYQDGEYFLISVPKYPEQYRFNVTKGRLKWRDISTSVYYA